MLFKLVDHTTIIYRWEIDHLVSQPSEAAEENQSAKDDDAVLCRFRPHFLHPHLLQHCFEHFSYHKDPEQDAAKHLPCPEGDRLQPPFSSLSVHL